MSFPPLQHPLCLLNFLWLVVFQLPRAKKKAHANKNKNNFFYIDLIFASLLAAAPSKMENAVGGRLKIIPVFPTIFTAVQLA